MRGSNPPSHMIITNFSRAAEKYVALNTICVGCELDIIFNKEENKNKFYQALRKKWLEGDKRFSSKSKKTGKKNSIRYHLIVKRIK